MVVKDGNSDRENTEKVFVGQRVCTRKGHRGKVLQMILRTSSALRERSGRKVTEYSPD